MTLKKPEKIYETEEDATLKNERNNLGNQEFNAKSENLEKTKREISEITKKLEEKNKEILLRSNISNNIDSVQEKIEQIDIDKILKEKIKDILLSLPEKEIQEITKGPDLIRNGLTKTITINTEVIAKSKILGDQPFLITITIGNEIKEFNNDNNQKESGLKVIEHEVKGKALGGGVIGKTMTLGTRGYLDLLLYQRLKNFNSDLLKELEDTEKRKVKNIEIENGKLEISFKGEIEKDNSNIEVEKLDILLREKEELETKLEKLNNSLSELNQEKIDLDENINQDIEIHNENEKVLNAKNILKIKHAIFNLSPERKKEVLNTEDNIFNDPNVWGKLKKLINLPNNEIIILIDNWEEWTKTPKDENLQIAGTRLLTTLAEALNIKISEENKFTN